jgi:hypothetical protein
VKTVRFTIEVDWPDKDHERPSVRINCNGPHELAAQMFAVANMMQMFAISSPYGEARALDDLFECVRRIQESFGASRPQ